MDFVFAGRKPSFKRIAFFINFIDSFGYGRIEFFKSINLKTTMINNWMTADDISISWIFRICKLIGYNCYIYLEPKDEKAAIEYENRAFRTARSGSEYSNNLDFLKDFLEIEKMSAATLCSKIGKSRSRLTYWYSVDDIALSRIYEICHAFDRNLHVVFKPAKQPEHRDGSEVIYELHRTHCYSFGENFYCDKVASQPTKKKSKTN